MKTFTLMIQSEQLHTDV